MNNINGLPDINLQERKKKEKKGFIPWLKGVLGMGTSGGAMGSAGAGGAFGSAGGMAGGGSFLGSLLAGKGALLGVAALAVIAAGTVVIFNDSGFDSGLAGNIGGNAFKSDSSGSSASSYTPAILKADKLGGSSLDMLHGANKGTYGEGGGQSGGGGEGAEAGQQQAEETAGATGQPDSGQMANEMIAKMAGGAGAGGGSSSGGSDKFSALGGFGNKFGQGSVGPAVGFNSGLNSMPSFGSRAKMLAMKGGARAITPRSASMGKGIYNRRGAHAQAKALQSNLNFQGIKSGEDIKATMDKAYERIAGQESALGVNEGGTGTRQAGLTTPSVGNTGGLPNGDGTPNKENNGVNPGTCAAGSIECEEVYSASKNIDDLVQTTKSDKDEVTPWEEQAKLAMKLLTIAMFITSVASLIPPAGPVVAGIKAAACLVAAFLGIYVAYIGTQIWSQHGEFYTGVGFMAAGTIAAGLAAVAMIGFGGKIVSKLVADSAIKYATSILPKLGAASAAFALIANMLGPFGDEVALVKSVINGNPSVADKASEIKSLEEKRQSKLDMIAKEEKNITKYDEAIKNAGMPGDLTRAENAKAKALEHIKTLKADIQGLDTEIATATKEKENIASQPKETKTASTDTSGTGIVANKETITPSSVSGDKTAAKLNEELKTKYDKAVQSYKDYKKLEAQANAETDPEKKKILLNTAKTQKALYDQDLKNYHSLVADAKDAEAKSAMAAAKAETDPEKSREMITYANNKQSVADDYRKLHGLKSKAESPEVISSVNKGGLTSEAVPKTSEEINAMQKEYFKTYNQWLNAYDKSDGEAQKTLSVKMAELQTKIETGRENLKNAAGGYEKLKSKVDSEEATIATLKSGVESPEAMQEKLKSPDMTPEKAEALLNAWKAKKAFLEKSEAQLTNDKKELDNLAEGKAASEWLGNKKNQFRPIKLKEPVTAPPNPESSLIKTGLKETKTQPEVALNTTSYIGVYTQKVHSEPQTLKVTKEEKACPDCHGTLVKESKEVPKSVPEKTPEKKPKFYNDPVIESIFGESLYGKVIGKTGENSIQSVTIGVEKKNKKNPPDNPEDSFDAGF